MDFDAKKLAEILVKATAGQESVTDEVKEFVSLLAEHRMLDRWREIEQAIEGVWKEEYGVATIQVNSAHALSAEALSAIEKIAKGADVTTKVESELIGGAVIRLDDKITDGSMAGSLKKLTRSLA